VGQRVQRRDELSLRQIAGRSEDDQTRRVRNALLIQTLAQRVGSEFLGGSDD
jgi:hypothetical protein